MPSMLIKATYRRITYLRKKVLYLPASRWLLPTYKLDKLFNAVYANSGDVVDTRVNNGAKRKVTSIRRSAKVS